MSAYLVVDISVTHPETYEEYKALAPPSIAQYQGRYIARGGATEILEGDWSPTRLVILEFPNMERAKAWWASSEYSDAKAMRQRSATTRMVLVDGLPGVPG